MSDKTIIVTRPEYDDTTTYLSRWSEPILNEAGERGMKCIDLNRNKANKKDFESYVRKNPPNFIVLNGHGNQSTVAGQDDNLLIEAGTNEDILSDAIVFARACDSAAILGERAVEKGAASYIGCTKGFVFPFDKNRVSTPQKDEIARPCLEVSNSIPLSLLKGQNVGLSLSRSENALKKWIEYLRTHYTIESPAILFSLLWNAACQKALGNISVKI